MREPDPRTVRAAAAGDRAAFTELMRDTQADVWRFIRHLVGDGDLAADLTQDVFLRVHRSLASFRGDSRFSTWLLRIARNVTIDEQRRAARRVRSVPLDAAPSLETPGPALAVELGAALADLPVAQREAIVLVEVFGRRYRDAAEIIGIAEGTVKSRVFHARAALARWFDEGDEEVGRRG